jgi:hypothetical protein
MPRALTMTDAARHCSPGPTQNSAYQIVSLKTEASRLNSPRETSMGFVFDVSEKIDTAIRTINIDSITPCDR